MENPNNKGNKRNNLSVPDKLKLIHDVEDLSMKVPEAAAKWDVSCATVRRILKNRDNIRQYQTLVPTLSVKATRVVHPTVRQMEQLLLAWLEDLNNKGLPVDGNMIQVKALSLHKELAKDTDNGDSKFNGSRGWLQRFQQRYGVHNVKIHGEKSSADTEGAKKFCPEFQRMIEDGGYSLDQVYDCDETRVFYKKMPSKSYIVKQLKTMPGRKADKKAFTLLFCSNASGSHLTKPLLIGTANQPRALKNVNRDSLAVHYRSNKNGWMTSRIFTDWVYNCFAPEAEAKCKELNLSFKILLLLDNAACHPHELEHPNIQLVFLPPNTTSLIQPLDQGIIANFKLHYVRLSYGFILEQMDEGVDLIKAWKEFSIKNSIDCVGEAAKKVKSSTLRNCWNRLLKPKDNHAERYLPDESLLGNIIELAKRFGANNFGKDDIDELFAEEELSNDELLAADDESEIDEDSLFTPALEEFDEHVDNLNRLLTFVSLDNNTERAKKLTEMLSNTLDLITEWKDD